MTRRHDVAPGKDMWPKSLLPVVEEDDENREAPEPLREVWSSDGTRFYVGCEVVMLESDWSGLPKGTIGRVIGITRHGWLEIDWGFHVAWNSASGWSPVPGRFMLLGNELSQHDKDMIAQQVVRPTRKLVTPQPLMLAWVGGGYGLRPRLLGTVPEGTRPQDVDAEHAVIGTLDEFLSAYLNPGMDY
jgi:hypothetical protein